MNRRIEVPVVFAILSAAMNVIFVLGLVIGVITGNGTLSLMTPPPEADQPLAGTATATATATVAPTKTPTQTASPTRQPTATPIPCKAGEVPGIDCAIDVGGLAVTVVSQERGKTYFNNIGIEKGPRDESYEVLIIKLRLPLGTIPTDFDTWSAPMVIDEAGNIYQAGDAWPEEVENGFGVVLVFAIPKDIKGLTLIIQPGDEVDLSLVPDLTAASETAQPTASQSGGPAESAGGQVGEPTEMP